MASEPCLCDAVDAGCKVFETGRGLELQPLIATCGGACDSNCAGLGVEAVCHLYDLAPGSYEIEIGAFRWTVAVEHGASAEPLECSELLEDG